MTKFDKIQADVCLVDCRFYGNTNGLQASIEILNEYPSIPILSLTAYEPFNKEL